MASQLSEPVMPSELEINQAQNSLKLLKQDKSNSHFVMASQTGLKVPITESVFDLLLQVLTELSRGNALRVIPVNAELTTQEAADLLNVSRPYLVKLLEDKKIPFHMTGSHRRILFKDLMEFRTESKKAQYSGLEELTKMDDDSGMGLCERWMKTSIQLDILSSWIHLYWFPAS